MSELFIERHGHGDRHIVLLHGWAMHGGIFAPLTAALAETFCVHVVDLPGHGYSRDCVVPLELDACTDAIAAATPPAAWLGWSLGGLLALRAARRHRDHVHALAMICASPRFTRGTEWPHAVDATMFRQFGAALKDDFRGTINRFLSLEAMGSERAHDDARQLRARIFARGEPDPRVLQQGIDLLCASDLRASLPEIGQSSVWIAGQRDRLVPAAAMAWSADRCGGTHVNVRHAGHAPFIGANDAVMRALRHLHIDAAA